ncbi:sulfurtransferase [Bacteroidia bacterium]|nr:sulfurtransferase [Bacteroidia bacterium]GHU71738.1 sulfurtransferase [Bacteroidia bacterium]
MNQTLIIILAAMVVFLLIKKLITNKNQKKMVEIINSDSNTLIVDVRSKEEFRGGHIENSVNIPLDRISGETEKLRKYNHIIVVCASGMRSAQAKSILAGKGLKSVHNGGAWQSLNSNLK